MSDYHRKKVLRIPFEEVSLNPDSFIDTSYALWEMYGDIFYHNDKTPVGKFDIAPTEDPFIDFVLEDEYGADSGDWGKVRKLNIDEQIKYYPIFKKLNPDINMEKVHLVEFCWYNCCEAPSYYSMEEKDDPFYAEIPLIYNFEL